MNDIPIHDYITIWWIDLFPHDDTGDNSDLLLLCSSLHICVFDWCNEDFSFWPTDITILPAEEKFLEEVVKEGFKQFTQTGLFPHYMTSRMRKKDRSAPCPYDSVHQLALLYTYQCSSMCEHISSENSRIYIIVSKIESSSE